MCQVHEDDCQQNEEESDLYLPILPPRSTGSFGALQEAIHHSPHAASVVLQGEYHLALAVQ